MDLSGAIWRKSSRSGENGGNCVELTALPAAVAVRDSKHPDGPMLVVVPSALRAAALATPSA